MADDAMAGDDGLGLAPDGLPAEGTTPPPMSDEDRATARMQAAIFDAYAEWVDDVESEGAPTATMTPDGPSEYPQFAYLLDSPREQQERLLKAVNDARSNASAG